MMNNTSIRHLRSPVLILAALLLGGCGNKEQQDRDFHTSGSREADQRAEQRIAKAQQLRGEGGDEPAVKKSLFERLGGDAGIDKIVEDWINRAMSDPRVNWRRSGLKRGGFSFWRSRSLEWKGDAQAVARMKKHIAQFVKIATGGPATYGGRPMKDVHANMSITNANFDAAVGDLKATLDKLGVPTEEQKELLAIIETTRPQVATER
ncbi:MAG TPA: group 1 truncated hemoglobin [Tepidisphaeraceae bacterium]|nr:group 1 truncated hemoglobin [Tepidisphaeraceae bacterium]